MKLTRIAAMTSLVVATAVVGAGTVQAAPASAGPQRDIQYRMELVDKTVVTTLVGGTFKVAANQRAVDIADQAGNAVMRLPLAFNLDSVSHPVNAKVVGDGTVLELTPDMDRAKARAVFVRPVASPTEDQRALSMFSSYFSVGTSIGTFIGTAAGVVIGAVVGCILGAPFFGLGCIPAATVGASLGAIVGTIVVGGPVLAIAGYDLFTTLTAPPGTSKFADKKPETPTPAPEAPRR